MCSSGIKLYTHIDIIQNVQYTTEHTERNTFLITKDNLIPYTLYNLKYNDIFA